MLVTMEISINCLVQKKKIQSVTYSVKCCGTLAKFTISTRTQYRSIIHIIALERESQRTVHIILLFILYINYMLSVAIG
jgi:hypothetical protein